VAGPRPTSRKVTRGCQAVAPAGRTVSGEADVREIPIDWLAVVATALLAIMGAILPVWT
jgi:hypothetical protein